MASYALLRREGSVGLPSQSARRPGHAIVNSPPGLDWLDCVLVYVFLLGLYTAFTIQITEKVPFPSMPSGIAGLILLWRRRDMITPKALGGLIGVVALYLGAVLSAPDIAFLSRRTNGLIQITYSIIIGYGVFLTVTRAERRQFANLFLLFALIIAVGCVLETHAGLKSVSDSVRQVLYSKGIYENDLRDLLLYNRVRPKFFASEPSSVTFLYALCGFLWMVASPWRWKLLAYIALVGLGLFAIPGPTLLLMLVLVVPYLMFLASRKHGRLDVGRLLLVACLSAVLLGAFVVLAQTLYSERLKQVMSGDDPSFFYRVQGPALAGLDIMKSHPIAGAGLTGEPYIEERVTNVYVRSPAYSAGWAVESAATELLINYFWLHWIYLGVVWGLIITVAIAMWLRNLGVPSVAFCFIAWAILGQASGAYVGPTCWAVLFLTGAAAVMHEQQGLPRKAGGTYAPYQLRLRQTRSTPA